jgi:hypothetical protein
VFSAALLFGFNALSLIPESFGMNISETATNVISIGTFILMYTKGFFYLAVNVYEKIRAWLEIKDGTVFDRAIIENMKISRPTSDINTDIVNHERTETDGRG